MQFNNVPGHVTAPQILSVDEQDRQKAPDNLKQNDDLDDLNPFPLVFQRRYGTLF